MTYNVFGGTLNLAVSINLPTTVVPERDPVSHTCIFVEKCERAAESGGGEISSNYHTSRIA